MASEDMTNYFSLQDRIKELETKLKNSRCTASRYRLLYEELHGKKELTPGGKARLLIAKLKGTGKPPELIIAIAKKCFLSKSTVSNLWYNS